MQRHLIRILANEKQESLASVFQTSSVFCKISQCFKQRSNNKGNLFFSLHVRTTPINYETAVVVLISEKDFYFRGSLHATICRNVNPTAISANSNRIMAVQFRCLNTPSNTYDGATLRRRSVGATKHIV